jgi:hypothetical protein
MNRFLFAAALSALREALRQYGRRLVYRRNPRAFWRTLDGRLLKPSEMDGSHIINCRRLLWRRVNDARRAIRFSCSDTVRRACQGICDESSAWIARFDAEIARRDAAIGGLQ